MKDLEYLRLLREELGALIALRRTWDRRANLPGSSPKVIRLRAEIETKIKRVQSLAADL